MDYITFVGQYTSTKVQIFFIIFFIIFALYARYINKKTKIVILQLVHCTNVKIHNNIYFFNISTTCYMMKLRDGATLLPISRNELALFDPCSISLLQWVPYLRRNGILLLNKAHKRFKLQLRMWVIF